MYNVDELKAMLDKSTPEELANAFTKNLNAAIQEKRKQEENSNNKIADFATIIRSGISYIDKYYPDLSACMTLIKDEDIDEIAKDLVELFDKEVASVGKELDDLLKVISAVNKKKISTEKTVDPLEGFLKAYGLK